jgi:predicted dehydrogenase
MRMKIAIVGCGFVADYYVSTLPAHPELVLVGATDRVPERAAGLCRRNGIVHYPSIAELLNDDTIELVLNLTNPREHFEVSKAALSAGKHVYSEKPLAMDMPQARELMDLAKQQNLQLSSAPCSALSETAQTLWKTIRAEAVGTIRVVYAEMDDGMVHLMPYRKWQSESGIPWPYKDEFEIGCTLEHAGYYLTWLLMWFGPATSVTSFASIQVPDKLTDEPLNMHSPDFSVACIQFESGVVARLTCSILAPHDHTLRIIGDKGVIYTRDSWHYHSPVYIRRMINIRRRALLNPFRSRVRLLKSPFPMANTKGSQKMDFARGPAEVAAAVREGRPSMLSNEFSLHANELALAIHHAREQGSHYRMTTTFEQCGPLDWAK